MTQERLSDLGLLSIERDRAFQRQWQNCHWP